MNQHQELFSHIRKFKDLNISDESVLTAKIKYRKVKRKEFLLQEHQVCNAYYFVLRGCLRLYRNTDSGTEQVLQFAIGSWWISDFQSFEAKAPSEYNIQAVQDTEVLILTRFDYEELFTMVPVLESYFRLMMQKAYTASLKKIELLLCESAEERYIQFVNTFPGFVQTIPQYMLASFLGFTPQFLSMLRARKE